MILKDKDYRTLVDTARRDAGWPTTTFNESSLVERENGTLTANTYDCWLSPTQKGQLALVLGLVESSWVAKVTKVVEGQKELVGRYKKDNQAWSKQ